MSALPKTVITPTIGNLKLLKASELRDAWGLNLLLYGLPGAGKTTLAASAQDSPHGRDVLFVDVEGGGRAIADRADIDVVRPTAFAEVGGVYDFLAAGSHRYGTVVVDSLTEVEKMLMPELPPSRDGGIDYGAANRKIGNLVRAFRGLSARGARPINVVFTALVRQDKDQATGAFDIKPALNPGAAMAVMGIVDALGYLTFDAKTGRRVLRFQGDGRFAAKLRQPQSGEQVPAQIEDPTLVEVLRLLRSAHPTAERGKEVAPMT